VIADAAVPVADRRVGAIIGAAAIFVALTTVASRNGGYFPTSFGWSALVFAWCVLVLVLVVRDAYLSTYEVAFAGGLTAFAGWIWLSVIWSRSVPATVLEGERALVYVTAVAALVLVGRRVGAAAVLGGMTAAIAAVSVYALTTRLFPERVGTFDPVSGYRLFAPIGYWNALGLFAAIGSLLALGFLARGRSLPARAVAAAALVVLLPTIYFTFSRGAWLALAIAVAAAIAVDPRRLQLCLALLVALPAPAVAVVVASRSHALTTVGASLAVATHQGHRLAVLIIVLAMVAAALGAALGVAETRVTPRPGVRRAFAAVLIAVVLAAFGASVVNWGAPWHSARHAWHAFVSAAPVTGPNLNKRLFHLSGTGRIVSWKSALHEFQDAPLAGTGAGTFETWWLAHRPVNQQIRDAHSLYLETLGELGIIGLVLLVGTLLVPLVGAWRRRREPLVPFALAGFLAWVVHAAVDWDWEIAAVTLAALACATVCLQGLGRREWHLGVAGRTVIATAAGAVAVFALVAAVGNQALASSSDALANQNYAKADAEARRAARWAPWSADPWIVRGQLDSLNQDPRAAQLSFRTAISHDPRNYLAWYGLAAVERGAARKQAVAEVVRLNPLSEEAAELHP
jgi:O-antigen ligase